MTGFIFDMTSFLQRAKPSFHPPARVILNEAQRSEESPDSGLLTCHQLSAANALPVGEAASTKMDN